MMKNFCQNENRRRKYFVKKKRKKVNCFHFFYKFSDSDCTSLYCHLIYTLFTLFSNSQFSLDILHSMIQSFISFISTLYNTQWPRELKSRLKLSLELKNCSSTRTTETRPFFSSFSSVFYAQLSLRPVCFMSRNEKNICSAIVSHHTHH